MKTHGIINLTRVVLVACLVGAGSANAIDVFKADNSDNLNLGTSWASGTPPTGADVAVWDSTVTAANTVNLGATTNWAGIRLATPGGGVTITNASTTLIIGASGVDTSAGAQTLTLSCPVAIATNNANNPWNIVGSVTLGGGLSGTNILEKTGSGSITLTSGTGAATIQIDAGQVILNASSGTITNALNGGTVTVNAAVSNPINVMSGGGTEQNAGGNRTWSGALSGSGALTVSASAIHTWNGNNSAYTGMLTEQGSGSLRLSSVNSVSTNTAYVINGTMNGNATGVFNLGSLAGVGTVGIAGSTPTWSVGALNANSDFSGTISGAAASLVKTGTGTQTLSGTNTYAGITIVSNGVLQIGNGGSSGSLASPTVFVTNATSTLAFNRSDSALIFTNVITGIGVVQNDGIGTVLLNGANNWSGGTILNNGALAFAANALGTGGIIFSNNNAALQWASGNTADISSQTVTIGSTGGTLDVNGNTVTLANPIGNSGSGALTVKSTAANGVLILQGANTFSGGTFVNSGTLRVNNASGSGTGSGSVTVNGGTLGGTGTISGAVDVQSSLAPGSSVGTLTVGSLTLESTSTNSFEFNSTPANDKVVVATSGGFVVNGGAFNLYTEGGTTAWTTPGTYNLIQFSGTAPSLNSSWTTVSGTNPHVANPQTGFQYAFSISGGFLRVTISALLTANIGTWGVDANGNWSAAGNWTATSGTMPPRFAGDSATFGTGSALRTVTLDANETNGAITMNNANSFVIANAGKVLKLDNSGSGANVSVSAGTANAIQTSVALSDNANIAVSAGKVLAISGVVSNTGASKVLTVSGAGSVSLSGNNSYGPAASSGFGTTLSGGGTLQVGHNNALGAGDVSISASGTVQAGAGGLNVPNNVAVASGATVTLDNNGNNLTLSGVISDSGNLTKIGNGTLTLAGNNTYSGNTVLNSGVLSLSADANLGTSPTLNLNGGSLLGSASFTLSGSHNLTIGSAVGAVGTNAPIDAASGQAFQIDSLIASAGNSGANNLIINSLPGDNGTVILNNVNTFTGSTTISNGTLQLLNSFALQNSTVNYDTGTLSFDGSLTGATIGALACTTASHDLALTNLSGGAVTLSANRNNATTIFGGSLSGSGGIIKQGTGTLTISNANYTGATTIGGGAGVLNIYGGSFGSSSSAFSVGTGGNTISNATMNASAINIGTAGGQTGAGITLAGSANATNATTVTIGSAGNTAGGFTVNTTGAASLGAVLVNRNAGAVTTPTSGAGLVVNNGTVIATSVSIAQSGVSGRGADLNINGGSLTVGDSLSTGVFAINSTVGNGFITMSGGSLNYLGTDGLLMSIGGGLSAFTMKGGTATLTGVTLNATNTGTVTSTLTMAGTNATPPTLYLGSIGLVANQPSATVSVTLSNGVLGATADWTSSAPVTLTGDATFRAADAASVAHNISLSGVLSGAGGVTKTGGGTVTLSGANTYTGNTTVSAGTLVLQQASLASTSSVSVSNSAVLQLNFATTNQVAALILNGVSKTNGVYGSSTPGGYLAGTGYLRVQALGPTGAGVITNSVSGNQLTLTWPAGQGWRLQSATNLSSPIFWTYLTDGSVSSTNITVDLTKPSIFYRLAWP